jgi:Peptidase family M28
MLRMNAMIRTCLILAFLSAAQPALADPQLDSVIRELRSEVRANEAMDHMYRVYETDRWFTFPKFQETVEYLRKAMSAAGLADVELVSPPADGVTQYGYWTMPLAWDVKQATLEIIEPPVPPEMRVLADYRKIPASLGMWSGPTPPGGITVEVVELRDLGPASIEKADLKGKLIMVRDRTYANKLPFIKKGAVGIINAFTENQALRDGHWWVNYWGDSGWGYTKASTPLVCFSITPRQADFLSGLLARRGRVRVKANVESRYYSGTYPYATAVLKGSGLDEEVLELGHTTEVGANDNAVGVAAMLESLASLNRLVESGKLKRPRRSIRMLAMPELYGSMHYVASNPERIRKTVAAICLDTGAGSYDLAGTEYAFILNPDVARSYTDALMLRVAETYFSRLSPKRFWHWSPFMTGTDTFLSDPLIGVPTVWTYGQPGVNTHHNSEDVPQRVDPRSMRDLMVTTAAFLYYVAAAGEAEIPWLAEITASRGYENLLRASGPALDRVAAASKPEELSRALHEGLEQISYCADRDEAAVLSVLRLAEPANREKLRASLAPVIRGLRNFEREQSQRVTGAVNRRAAHLGAATPIKPLVPAVNAEAAGMVVKRKRIGTITLDDLPTDQWEGQPSAAWDARLITALNWCDGRRNLAEVIRLTELERGPTNFDFVKYFRFLARHGYVEIAQAK